MFELHPTPTSDIELQTETYTARNLHEVRGQSEQYSFQMDMLSQDEARKVALRSLVLNLEESLR